MSKCWHQTLDISGWDVTRKNFPHLPHSLCPFVVVFVVMYSYDGNSSGDATASDTTINFIILYYFMMCDSKQKLEYGITTSKNILNSLNFLSVLWGWFFYIITNNHRSQVLIKEICVCRTCLLCTCVVLEISVYSFTPTTHTFENGEDFSLSDRLSVKNFR